MKTTTLFFVLTLALVKQAQPQNIGINVNGAAPNPTALLDIDGSALSGTQRGVLVPRMTNAQMTGISGPALSLLVFNTDSNCFFFYNGALWVNLCRPNTALVANDTIKTLFPQPVYMSPNSSNVYLAGDNSGCVGMFKLENPMEVNTITLIPNSVSVPGSLRIGIYTEDGQSKLLDQTTGVISVGNSAYTQNLSPGVTLSRGNYYFAVVPIADTELTLYVWLCFTAASGTAYTVPGKAKPAGTINVTPGLLPASFNPVTDVTYIDQQHSLMIVRFDN